MSRQSRRSAAGATLSALVALAAACGGGTPVEGPLHEVVAVVSADRWSELEHAVRGAIERRVSGVSDERVFTVVHQEPDGEGWEDRSHAPLLVLIGTMQDPWIQAAIEEAEPRPHEPGLSRVLDLWAEGQVANVLVVPESGEDEELEEHLEVVYAQLHADLRAMVRAAMYVEGAQSELADSLWANEGFGILIHDTYAWSRTDSTFLFWPEGEGADADVEQRIAVTWMNPAPPSLEIDEVLAWRERTAREHYGTPQDVTDRVTAERLAFAGYVALEVRGQWMRRTESGVEQGPLLTRVAVCEGQNRAYLLDSWLHTPTAETYEHVVQLETILDTFRCE